MFDSRYFEEIAVEEFEECGFRACGDGEGVDFLAEGDPLFAEVFGE